MKKIISLLAVALFATIFAAGCGKADKCDQASKKEDCEKSDFFEKDKGDKGNCMWDAKADNNKGKCVVKSAGSSGSGVDLSADTKLCEAAKKDQKTCDDESGKLASKATHKCKFTAETSAGKGDQKCEITTNK